MCGPDEIKTLLNTENYEKNENFKSNRIIEMDQINAYEREQVDLDRTVLFCGNNFGLFLRIYLFESILDRCVF